MEATLRVNTEGGRLWVRTSQGDDVTYNLNEVSLATALNDAANVILRAEDACFAEHGHMRVKPERVAESDVVTMKAGTVRRSSDDPPRDTGTNRVDFNFNPARLPDSSKKMNLMRSLMNRKDWAKMTLDVIPNSDGFTVKKLSGRFTDQELNSVRLTVLHKLRADLGFGLNKKTGYLEPELTERESSFLSAVKRGEV